MDSTMFSRWRKSSFSSGDPNNCVEVGLAPGRRAVRDSKNPDGPVLVFRPAALAALVACAGDRES